MREITPEDLQQIVPNLSAEEAQAIAAGLNPALAWADISTPARQAAFLAQVAHESMGLKRFTENLNYSAPGLRKTFPRYFTDAEAEDYARQPERIANRAYANRLGNGDEESGDGWRYRGRGPIQLTGKGNYLSAGNDLDLDLVGNPDQVASSQVGFSVAAWFWLTGGNSLDNPRQPDCNEMADAGDFIQITKRINGALAGLKERQVYWARAQEALGA